MQYNKIPMAQIPSHSPFMAGKSNVYGANVSI